MTREGGMGKIRLWEIFADYIGEVLEGEGKGQKIGWGVRDPKYALTLEYTGFAKALFFYNDITKRISKDNIESYSLISENEDGNIYVINFPDGKSSKIFIIKRCVYLVHESFDI